MRHESKKTYPTVHGRVMTRAVWTV